LISPDGDRGLGGVADDKVFTVAMNIAVGFDLDVTSAVAVIKEEWGDRCEPPWKEKELERTVKNARKLATEPAGYLLDSNERGAEYLSPIVRTPPKPETPKYPGVKAVKAVLEQCVPVAEDEQVAGWLRSRGLAPELITEAGTCFALQRGASTPAWAAGWLAGDFRCLFPLYDSEGRMVSLRARKVVQSKGRNETVPKGYHVKGLVMANRPARAGLQGEGMAGLVVAEGEPDFLTAVQQWSPGGELPVMGIFSGSWAADMAAAVPEQIPVVICTDNDGAGDKYALQIAAGLSRPAHRLTPPKGKDLNDMLKDGTLPADPFDGAEPYSAPAEPKAEPEAGPGGLDKEAPWIGGFLDSALAQMERRRTGEELPVSLPWPKLKQKLSGGLWPGCHLLTGGTGTGKSQFALQIALHAAKQGQPVLYVGLELGPTDLVARLLGLMSGQQWSQLWHGKSPEPGQEHLQLLRGLPIRMAVAPPKGWDHTRLYRLAAEMRAGKPKGPLLMVVDYLQLVSSPAGEAGQTIAERISSVGYAARAAAREHDIAVLLLSSVARDKIDTKAKPGGGPAQAMQGHGKYSGDLEFAGDTVLAFVPEPWPNPDRPPAEGTTVHLAIAKQRAGRAGWTELMFDGCQFTEPKQARAGDGLG